MAQPPALVERWCRAWSADPVELLALYAADAVSWSLGPMGRRRLAPDDLLEHERRSVLQVPDRAVEHRLTVDGEDDVVTEWLFTGRSAEDLVTMVSPGVTWWQLDADGRIALEVRVVDWSARVIGDDEQRRPLPDGSDEHHSQGWYRDFVERLLEVVAFDPALARRSAYAEGSTAVTMAAGTDAEPSRHVLRRAACAGRGRTVACLLDGGEEHAGQRGADPWGVVLLTLDGSDRVISERRYGAGWWPVPR